MQAAAYELPARQVQQDCMRACGARAPRQRRGGEAAGGSERARRRNAGLPCARRAAALAHFRRALESSLRSCCPQLARS